MSTIARFIPQLAIFLACAAMTFGQPSGPCTVETIVGNPTPYEGDGGPATNASLFLPQDIAVAPDGSIVIADTNNHRIRRIGTDGIIRTIAGNGQPARTGDGGLAVLAGINRPSSVAIGPGGEIYFAEDGIFIRVVNKDGTVQTLAGTGQRFAVPAEIGPALEMHLQSAGGLTVAADGTVFFVDSGTHRVRKLAAGVIETIAGTTPWHSRPWFGGDGGPAQQALLDRPTDLAIGPDDSIYIADSGNRRIRRISPDGIITTVAGSGAQEFTNRPNGDGGPATGAAIVASRIAVDSAGELYTNGVVSVRKIQNGMIDQFRAVNGSVAGIALKGADDIIVADQHSRILRMAGAGETAIIAGKSVPSPSSPTPAARVSADLDGLGFDLQGNLLFSSQRRVYRRLPNGQVTVFAGNGTSSGPLSSGPATDAAFPAPRNTAADSAGNIYVADSLSHVLRRVTPAGEVEAFAGISAGPPRLFDEPVPATSLPVGSSLDVVVDSQDNVYFLESGSGSPLQRILKVDREKIMTVAAPYLSPVSNAAALAFDASENLYVFDSNSGVYRLNPDRTLQPVFPLNRGILLRGMAFSKGGSLFVSSIPAVGMLRLDSSGRVENISRTFDRGFLFGEGQPLGDVTLNNIPRMAFGPSGDLFVPDRETRTVRIVREPEKCEGPAPPILPEGAVVNGASFASRLAVSPGEIISLFGWNLGPQNLALTSLDPNGRLATRVGGTRVLFDGVPAPVIFALAGQTSVVVPYEVAGTTEMLVELDGVPAHFPMTLGVRDTGPGLFTINASGRGQAAALNQDSSLNGVNNPAARGSVVVLFGTGEGRTMPALATGEIVGSALPVPLAKVSAKAGGQDAEVLYLGGSPGLVAGVFQANIRLPAGLGVGPVQVQIIAGGVASNVVTVEVQ